MSSGEREHGLEQPATGRGRVARGLLGAVAIAALSLGAAPSSGVAAEPPGSIISAEGATVADQRNISLIFKDDEGDPIAYAEVVELMVFASSAMLAFSAGGSTGIAAGADNRIGLLCAGQSCANSA